jgi:hypothetical protein
MNIFTPCQLLDSDKSIYNRFSRACIDISQDISKQDNSVGEVFEL